MTAAVAGIGDAVPRKSLQQHFNGFGCFIRSTKISRCGGESSKRRQLCRISLEGFLG